MKLQSILQTVRTNAFCALAFAFLADMVSLPLSAAETGANYSGVARTSLPTGEPLVVGDALETFVPHAGNTSGNARFQIVDTVGPEFNKAWRVDTLRDTGSAAAIELRALTGRPVAKGDIGMIRFFARSRGSEDETGTARVLLVIRRNGVDWNSSYEGDFPLTRAWQEILVPFTWAQAFAPGEAAIMMRFGFKRQSVEIGGISAIHYGRSLELSALPRTRFSYAGREPGAQWRKEAMERIEKIRKGRIGLRVTDSDGRPLEDATVTIEQTRSAFEWGTALQMELLVVDSPDNLRYREVLQELFNAASTENDLKWPAWQGDWGRASIREQTLTGLRWLHDRGFHTRGHVLVWPGRKNLPREVQALLDTPRQGEIPSLVLDHIRAIARATKGLLEEWDVLNEPFTNHDLMDLFGNEIMVTWFRVAREELPHARLFLNDFSNHDATTDLAHVEHFERTARYLLEHHAPLDGLGLQAHFNGRPNAPENILAVLDRYQREFHLPVRVTEFDVWTSDEELQADFTRDFLILMFSHPSVIGVQFWGFWEGRHWRPSAAMYREDWSEKPSAGVYKDLVLRRWRSEFKAKTDTQGRWEGRGFFGDYRVTVTSGTHTHVSTFSLNSGTSPERTIKVPR